MSAVSGTVFISYATPDAPVATVICAALEAAGVRTWIAPRDIPEGESWPRAISSAIASSRVLLLVLSQSANVSDEVIREVGLAIERRITVIPIRIEDVKPGPGLDYRLQDVQRIDAFPDWQTALPALLSALRRLGSVEAQVDRESPRKAPQPAVAAARQPKRLAMYSLAALIALGVIAAVAWRMRPVERTRMLVVPIPYDATERLSADTLTMVSRTGEPDSQPMTFGPLDMEFDGRPFVIDCGAPDIPVTAWMKNEIRTVLPNWDGSSLACADFREPLPRETVFDIQLDRGTRRVWCARVQTGSGELTRGMVVLGPC